MLKEISPENTKELREFLDSRMTDIPDSVMHAAMDILSAVRTEKDAACRRYTKQFDGIDMTDWRVTEEELSEAVKKCDPFFMESMAKAKENIVFFHNAQKQNSYLLQKAEDNQLRPG